ncbi:MAG: DUF5362 family protein [Bacteroidota bacterium]
MDEQPIFTNPNGNILVTSQAEHFLHSIKKWAKFLSIVGFIMVAFMFFTSLTIVFGGVAAGPYSGGGYPAVMSGMIGGAYLIGSLLYFFPVLYLYKFSNTLDKALVNRSGNYLEESFGHLKSNLQFVGIVTVLMIVFAIAMVIFGIYTAVASYS